MTVLDKKEDTAMATVEIYTRPMCGFCYKAKKVLDKKGVTYSEYNIWAEEARKDEMLERSNGGRTVPQIFINDEHIGGCSDLLALDEQGGLDEKLAADAA